MKLIVSRSHSRTAFFAAIGSVALVVATMGGGLSRAQEPQVTTTAEAGAVAEAAVERRADPYADRFPNLVLRTHEGKNVRFYDDLLKGKIVLINFMYVTCEER